MGIPTLISTTTITSATANAAFTGIDNTYDEYMWVIHHAVNSDASQGFDFNGSDDASSHSYDIIKTSTAFRTYHYEDDSSAALTYMESDDLGDSTAYQGLSGDQNNANADDAAVGILHLFSPASTTYVKHFYSRFNYSGGPVFQTWHVAGYFNTTAAITAIDFKYTSGNIEKALIQMYGIS